MTSGGNNFKDYP